jgi:lipopolysaccharide heptosyltransferase II
MAQIWVPTLRKKIMLSALDLAARTTSRRSSAGSRSTAGPDRVQRILVVELWNIGDVVLLMPFLGRLRALFPRARVTLLGREHAKAILAGTGLVDEFVETDLGWTAESTRLNPLRYRWLELLRLRGELRKRNFDLAFSCRMHVREHLILALSGAHRRVAYSLGNGDRVLTDPIKVGEMNRHKAEDWIKLLEPFDEPRKVDAPRLCVTDSERALARDFLDSQGVSPRDRVIGIHPGASVPQKRWPLDRFAQLATELVRRPGVRIVVFVEPGGYGQSLSAINGVVGAKVGLREMIALIDRCSLLVGNDSGPMHIAGALGVPTVAVFGTGIRRWFAPLGKGHIAVSRDDGSPPSFHAEDLVEPFDVSEVPVSRVLAAIDATEAINRD